MESAHAHLESVFHQYRGVDRGGRALVIGTSIGLMLWAVIGLGMWAILA